MQILLARFISPRNPLTRTPNSVPRACLTFQCGKVELLSSGQRHPHTESHALTFKFIGFAHSPRKKTAALHKSECNYCALNRRAARKLRDSGSGCVCVAMVTGEKTFKENEWIWLLWLLLYVWTVLAHTQRGRRFKRRLLTIAFASCRPPTSCRYRPPTFHVQAWYDEVKDYSFPYPQECNPYCPFRCSGPVCTHYTQVTTHGLYHCHTYHRNLIPCLLRAAGLGHEQSDRLCRQLVLQHERVGADLGQSCLSCLQLFTKVS